MITGQYPGVHLHRASDVFVSYRFYRRALSGWLSIFFLDEKIQFVGSVSAERDIIALIIRRLVWWGGATWAAIGGERQGGGWLGGGCHTVRGAADAQAYGPGALAEQSESCMKKMLEFYTNINPGLMQESMQPPLSCANRTGRCRVFIFVSLCWISC